MNYQFWNDFIDFWRSQPNFKAITPNPFYSNWFHTNTPLALLNTNNNPNDLSFEYLPEPWWGNSGIKPLYSVVINYNPGKGNNYQHFTTQNLLNLNNSTCYSDFVKNEVSMYNPSINGFKDFNKTNNWHYKNRALPVFNALGIIANLENHLSVELIPWHTPDTKTLQFNSYLTNNINAIVAHSLCFAANESRRIQGKLQNVVLIRMSETSITNILNLAGLQIQKLPNTKIQYTLGDNYFKFEIITPHHTCFKDIVFCSIWSKTANNNFPTDKNLDWIFTNVL